MTIAMIRKPGMELADTETGVTLEVTDVGVFGEQKFILSGKMRSIHHYVSDANDANEELIEFVEAIEAYGKSVRKLAEAWLMELEQKHVR